MPFYGLGELVLEFCEAAQCPGRLMWGGHLSPGIWESQKLDHWYSTNELNMCLVKKGIGV